MKLCQIVKIAEEVQTLRERVTVLRYTSIAHLVSSFVVIHIYLSGFTEDLTFFTIQIIMDRDNSVGIATRYGLDGPGIESRWERDFPHPSRQALAPTQPPIQWVPGLSRG